MSDDGDNNDVMINPYLFHGKRIVKCDKCGTVLAELDVKPEGWLGELHVNCSKCGGYANVSAF